MKTPRSMILAAAGAFVAGAALFLLSHLPGKAPAARPKANAAMRQTANALRHLRRALAPLGTVSAGGAVTATASGPGPFQLDVRRPRPPPVATAPTTPRIPPLRVSVILMGLDGRAARAMVNGRVVKAGDTVAGWKVEAITADAVTFRRGTRTFVRRVGESGEKQ